MIVNLTPHPLNIQGQKWIEETQMAWGHFAPDTLIIAPSGTVARVEETRRLIDPLFTQPDGIAWKFEVMTVARQAAVTGLPEAEADTVFVVSAAVMVAVPDRRDVFCPGKAIRDAEGRVIGAEGLCRLAQPEDAFDFGEDGE